MIKVPGKSQCLRKRLGNLQRGPKWISHRSSRKTTRKSVMVNFRCQSDGIKDPVFLDSRKSIISVYVGEAYPEDTGI